MGKMGKVPQPLEAPTKGSLPKQDHGGMEGKMLPPKKPTDLPWPRGTPKVGRNGVPKLYLGRYSFGQINQIIEDCDSLASIVTNGK